jgi:hypothetical protein
MLMTGGLGSLRLEVRPRLGHLAFGPVERGESGAVDRTEGRQERFHFPGVHGRIVSVDRAADDVSGGHPDPFGLALERALFSRRHQHHHHPFRRRCHHRTS